MRFLTQELGSGRLTIADGPTPSIGPRDVLVQTQASLVSAGTERMLVDFGRAGFLAKARQQPDRVRDVVDKVVTEGLGPTIDAVRHKLAQPLPLGYANAGVVTAIGDDVHEVSVGQLVASNGGHAELVAVPVTLVAPAPEGVSAEEACFATVAAVGLQGVRLAHPELGERFVVTGLGLVGLLTTQFLLSHGCEVLGVDPDADRRRRASAFGATVATPEDAELAAAALSGGMGVDGVLVCASTSSSEPMRAAARMSRQRGRVVLVGVTGLDLERAPLYEREITLQVSTAYGPGRYDPTYESGLDLPVGLVRWTAGRNMAAALAQMRRGRLNVSSLVTHRVDFREAELAYDTLVGDSTALGILLTYAGSPAPSPAMARGKVAVAEPRSRRVTPGKVAVVGAGNFATRTLLPAIAAAGATIDVVVSPSGVSAQLAAQPHGARASSDLEAVLSDPTIGAVFVATRHDSHATLAAKALRAGKAVYVEKPLALREVELEELQSVVAELDEAGTLPVLTVGFNRRLAPITVRMQELLASTTAPRAIVVTVNAGSIPLTHWIHDPTVGGGRILGEACHFIDLARHLAGAPITSIRTEWLTNVPSADDSATVSVAFENGSTAHVHYLTNGAARFPKERVEVFCGGRVAVNENFRRLRTYGWGRRRFTAARQDKGHVASIRQFLAAAREGAPAPIPWPELVEVSASSIAAARSS